MKSGRSFMPPEADVRIIHWGYIAGPQMQKKSRRNINLLKSALEKEPDDFFYHFYLGREYFNLGHYDEASKEYREAESLIPPGNPMYHAALLLAICESLQKGGCIDEALEYGRIARERYPDYRDVIFRIGELHAAAGEPKRALEAYSECAKMTVTPTQYFQARQGLDVLARKKVEEFKQRIREDQE